MKVKCAGFINMLRTEKNKKSRKNPETLLLKASRIEAPLNTIVTKNSNKTRSMAKVIFVNIPGTSTSVFRRIEEPSKRYNIKTGKEEEN